MFINPHYREPKLEFFGSQHPYLESAVGKPYVCPMAVHDEPSVLACVQQALDGPDLPPTVPPDMTRDAYLGRVKAMLGPLLQGPVQGQEEGAGAGDGGAGGKG